MSRTFRYCGLEGSVCGWGSNVPLILGSFVGGPWALRPKRLQWLINITAGFKIAAFPRLEKAKAFSASRALPQFFLNLRILIGRKALAETSPPFFHHAQAPP